MKMGYSRCAFPSCSSVKGKGMLFRRFPRTENLSEEWMKHLPNGLKVGPNAVFCELHFGQDQFEKPRQDGKKRLKDSAIPNVIGFPKCVTSNQPAQPNSRSVFSEVISNSVNQSMLTPKLPKHNTLTRNRHDRVFCGDHTYARSYNLEQGNSLSPPEEVEKSQDLEFEVLHVTTTVMLADQPTHDTKSVSEPTSKSVDTKIITESTNLTVNTEILSESTNQLVPQEGQILPLEDVLLDPVTGLISGTFTPIQRKVQDVDITPENILLLLAEQRSQLAAARRECEEKDRQNEALQKIASRYLSGYQRCNALKRINHRLNVKLQRLSHSPWLNKTQQQILSRKSTRGLKFDSSLIRDGLILKLKCGTTGYDSFVKKLPFYPSVRNLQKSVQFIKFGSGLLEEMIDLMGIVVKDMPDQEKDCNLVIDEMAITPSERYDASTKKMVGKATFPTHEGIANKALLFLLVGMTRRWKIPFAAYLNNKKKKEEKGDRSNSTGLAYKEIIDTIISRAESISLKVCGVTSDMGPDNLCFWKAYGVNATRTQPITSSFPNPGRPGASVYIMPDSVHLFKAIKTMMENNKFIILPENIVKEKGLPSSKVSYEHVQDLYIFEENLELKVAFRLKPSNINCNKHFDKMNVAVTRAVVCHRTSVGLKLLSEVKDDASYLTTAWFFEMLNTFFELVTARHISLGLSKLNKVVYEKAISHLHKVRYVFQHMKIGVSGDWKPCQRGMLVLIDSLLALQEYFLEERQYRYVMLGRTTSDCIESFFSCIRKSQPVPHAVAFFQNLKVLSLAQYSEVVTKSNYDYDETEALPDIDLLEEARKRAQGRAEATFYESMDELCANPVEKVTDRDLNKVSTWEQCVIYDMAGSTVNDIKKSNVRRCEYCLNALIWKGKEPHVRSVVTATKEFTNLRDENNKKLQVYVSDEVFKAILKAEVTFRLHRERVVNFKNLDIEEYFVSNLMYVWSDTRIPNCHNIGRRLLQFYINTRLKLYGSKRSEEINDAANQAQTTARSSKSVTYREVAGQITASQSKRVKTFASASKCKKIRK